VRYFNNPFHFNGDLNDSLHLDRNLNGNLNNFLDFHWNLNQSFSFDSFDGFIRNIDVTNIFDWDGDFSGSFNWERHWDSDLLFNGVRNGHFNFAVNGLRDSHSFDITLDIDHWNFFDN